ncbi:hypothetical protein P375_05770 [Gallibacterium genomosp. 2]|uniref:DUF4431 domain-containing protein n=3 Tax=Gallibacterium TaxID=155493 RepID=A0A0A2YHW7_9PAST|nr:MULTISPECIES: DUF4431 domain-containing protein [Gallibacterium]AEC16362.1 hypothetical protein UMN179_00325 [Gallibacterium anatis UMN179]KGQ32302.1 hypothetical protein P375_05770 [Gallibacterium genomosp. 2]KGQ32692.1 hypothetical protein JP34_08975 [Gallibacterium anatis]KGQ42145.1 hypothetical protein JP28_11845 [Gallibacterium anatis]KGQ57904.1 hypothetical protein IE01_03515 [Gallibacterium anatis DSM 16844 = F 149]
MNKILVTALSISLLGLSGFAQAKTYDYNTPIELKGVIKLENDYPMLYLKQGIDVNKKDFYDSAKNVKKMQVVNINRKPGEKTPTGCQIVTGTLFGWETAHHKTPVLIQAESFEKCK